MNFTEFMITYGSLPVIETENLLAGIMAPKPVEVQISRWRRSGKIIQLRRGIYTLAEPYRKVEVYEPYLAALLRRPSYLSLEKALEYHNLIPEAVPTYTSVTTKSPVKFVTRLGTFDYRHIRESLFWGYQSVVVNKQTAFIASPEKALLDLFYLRSMEVSGACLQELRLENTEKIHLGRLAEYAKRFGKPKILRAAMVITDYVRAHRTEEKLL